LGKCSGITRAGTACKGTPIDGSQWCYVHHPDRTDERRRHGSKGGRRGGRGRPQVEVNTVKERLWVLAEDTLAGHVDKGIAAVVNQVYGTYLKACSVGLDVEERLELIARVEELEEALARRKGERYGG
jgi:hypothetical protein